MCVQGTHDRDRGPGVWLDPRSMQLHVRITTDLDNDAGCAARGVRMYACACVRVFVC